MSTRRNARGLGLGISGSNIPIPANLPLSMDPIENIGAGAQSVGVGRYVNLLLELNAGQQCPSRAPNPLEGYWKPFYRKFFSPEARILTDVYSAATRSQRLVELPVEAMPRLRMSLFDTGALEDHMLLENPLEFHLQSGVVIVDCPRTMIFTTYEHSKLCTIGHLRVSFSDTLKITLWEFSAAGHEEFFTRPFAERNNPLPPAPCSEYGIPATVIVQMFIADRIYHMKKDIDAEISRLVMAGNVPHVSQPNPSAQAPDPVSIAVNAPPPMSAYEKMLSHLGARAPSNNFASPRATAAPVLASQRQAPRQPSPSQQQPGRGSGQMYASGDEALAPRIGSAPSRSIGGNDSQRQRTDLAADVFQGLFGAAPAPAPAQVSASDLLHHLPGQPTVSQQRQHQYYGRQKQERIELHRRQSVSAVDTTPIDPAAEAVAAAVASAEWPHRPSAQRLAGASVEKANAVHINGLRANGLQGLDMGGGMNAKARLDAASGSLGNSIRDSGTSTAEAGLRHSAPPGLSLFSPSREVNGNASVSAGPKVQALRRPMPSETRTSQAISSANGVAPGTRPRATSAQNEDRGMELIKASMRGCARMVGDASRLESTDVGVNANGVEANKNDGQEGTTAVVAESPRTKKRKTRGSRGSEVAGTGTSKRRKNASNSASLSS